MNALQILDVSESTAFEAEARATNFHLKNSILADRRLNKMFRHAHLYGLYGAVHYHFGNGRPGDASRYRA